MSRWTIGRVFSLVTHSASAARGVALIGSAVFFLSSCRGGSSVPSPASTSTAVGVLPGTQPTVAPSPPVSSGASEAAFQCPTSDAAAGMRRAPRSFAEDVGRMTPRRAPATSTGSAYPQLLAVSYDAQAVAARRTALAVREAALGATFAREFRFSHIDLVTRVLSVPTASAARIAAELRAEPGVRSVAPTGGRRYPMTVSQPYFPNDPYFTGFSNTVPPPGGSTPPPATYKVEPLVESAAVPGQWDMHVTRLEYAFAYSRSGNGSAESNALAIGSPNVKLAVIDTGEDTTHPELAAKIVYQRCFITDPSNHQSLSTFTTDEDGHGTDVAGLAGAATGNGLGFSGAGGNVVLYGYRIFPTPDDTCRSATGADEQCGTNVQDIASAVQDAVNGHVNVISLSLGGAACVNGVDPDPTEGNAIANAIAANIIVVAASGNASGAPVASPACDPGVIAVGATAIADGTLNGSGVTGGSPAAPLEYVPSYSDYGSPAAQPGSAAAWGIVAPGGDPATDTDPDNLHWVQNIWTSTPYTASSSDTTFLGTCRGDYPTLSGTTDCRILIAGTSMATPHVAGAAALIVSVNSSYQSPAQMKTLLCSTADDIGDPSEGCGRLDVYRAMATALGDPNIPGPQSTP